MASGGFGDYAEGSTQIDGHRRLSDLPDPLERYVGLIKQFNLRDTKVVAPDVRDRQGNVILPEDYEEKLHTGDVVTVEVYLKLWDIRPHNKGDKGAHLDNKNGSRVYHVMLKSMQVLPDASITATTFPDVHKGKCKAIDEAGPSKKPVRADDAADSAGEEDHEEEEDDCMKMRRTFKIEQ
ncbi:uncharacterized protein HD556DRAFT_680119 [Suillus plorans]|uniref:Uncharacterized protein n=1 Tax=Suillus plorans TaxID=116603 RepID=A0A9P7ALB7_9AGAM|nr:uncharacterized protein HD556DRAFT_680119 [Suillus plorans]KAG1790811.1 hypothetical protein HD556DRAFT_680119 [Suillus plorans]